MKYHVTAIGELKEVRETEGVNAELLSQNQEAHGKGQLKGKLELKEKAGILPSLAKLDQLNHWAVVIGFPFLSFLIISGAIWADEGSNYCGAWFFTGAVYFVWGIVFAARVAQLHLISVLLDND